MHACRDVIRGLEEVVLDQGCRPRALVKGEVNVRRGASPRKVRYEGRWVVSFLDVLTDDVPFSSSRGVNQFIHSVVSSILGRDFVIIHLTFDDLLCMLLVGSS